MANYLKCIPVILENEGGLVDNPNDTGGITNFGVSLRFAKDTNDLEIFDVDNDNDIDRQDIINMTMDRAVEGFKKYFWDKFKLDQEPSDKVALVIFDIAVNHGNGNASSMIQKALVDMGFKIAIDGIVGPKTLAALHQADPDSFIDTILNVRERFYRKIVERRPSQKVFLKGWLNRCNHLREIVHDF